MRACNYWWICLAIVLLLGSVGCTSNSIDDGDSADTIMEITQLTPTPITGQLSTGTCTNSGLTCLTDVNCDPFDPQDTCFIDPASAECEITEWTATVANKPKTELPTTPFSDLLLQDVTITYSWNNGFTIPPRTFPIAGAVEPEEELQVEFFPMTAEDLTDLRTFAPNVARSANVILLFRGRLVDGSSVAATAGAQLAVEACN